MRKVMLLPGIIAPAGVRYAPLISHLEDAEVVAKDLEVYSGDPVPPDYSISLEVAGIGRAADEAGFERFHLYGHSAGGAIALAYAAAHPDRLLSLSLDEPAYDFTEEIRADMDDFRAVADLPMAERMPAFMRLQVSDEVKLPPPDGPPPPFMASRPAGVNAFLVAVEQHDRLDGIYRDLRPPVLFTWGELTHPRWANMERRLRALFADFSSQRFDGLHHLNTSHQAEPERVAKLLDGFWTKAEARS